MDHAGPDRQDRERALVERVAELTGRLRLAEDELSACKDHRIARWALALDGVRRAAPGRERRGQLKALLRGGGERTRAKRRIDDLLADLPEDLRTLAGGPALIHDFPELRVGVVGATAPFAHVAPHGALRPWALQDDTDRPLDMVWVDAAHPAPFDRTALRDLQRVCRDIGVPTVFGLDGPSAVDDAALAAADLVVAGIGAEVPSAVAESQLLRTGPSIEERQANPVGRSLGAAGGVCLLDRRRPGEDGQVPAVLASACARLDLPCHAAPRNVALPQLVALARAHAVVVVDASQDPSADAAMLLTVRACGALGVLVDPGGSTQPHAAAVAPDMAGAADVVRTFLSDSVDVERRSVATRRGALREHSRRQRFSQILQRLGLHHEPEPLVSAIVATNRQDWLAHALQQVVQQRHPALELVLLTHGYELRGDLPVDTRGLQGVTVVPAPEDWRLGEVLNLGTRQARGSLVTKMDDDDFYGPDHIGDLVAAHRYSGAEIVGKVAHSMYSRASDVTFERQWWTQERWVPGLPGGTMLMRRSLLESVPYTRAPRGVDRQLVDSLAALGGRAYSTHRFGYVRHRHGQHTWVADDEVLLREGSGHRDGLDAALLST